MKLLLFAISAPFVLVLAGCHSEAPSSGIVVPSVAARVVTVGAPSGQQSFGVSGVVKPHLEADLSAQIVAPVAAVTKHEGDHFRRGEVLVRLYAPALGSGVAQSEASLKGAEQQAAAAKTQAVLAADTLTRYAQLRERHSVTPYELDQVKAQSAAAQAQQQSAAAQVTASRAAVAVQKANAADAALVAPFDGVVTRRMVDPGAMAAPGVPLLHLQSSGGNDVIFSAPDSSLRDLRPGASIPVIASGEQVSARIQKIAPGTDPGSHSFEIKASLPSGAGWLPGTIVQVQLPSSQSPVPVVPASAVLQQGGLDAVLAVGSDGIALVRYITTGTTAGGMVQVVSGLKSGDHILAEGNLALAGRKIKVLQ